MITAKVWICESKTEFAKLIPLLETRIYPWHLHIANAFEKNES
jgi:hypothetical protein